MEKEQEKLIKAVNAELEEWLCSGDTDYLHKAIAVIRAAFEKEAERQKTMRSVSYSRLDKVRCEQ